MTVLERYILNLRREQEKRIIILPKLADKKSITVKDFLKEAGKK